VLILLQLYRKVKPRTVYFVLCFILILLIIYRYQLFSNEFNKLGVRGNVVLQGKIIREPDIRDNNIKLTLQTNNERILITVARYPEYEYGDEIKVSGELEEPVVFDDFNYKNYLRKERIYSVMYYPKVEVLNENPSYLFSFKDKVRQVIYKNMPSPQSSILGAMLLGDKSRMSNDLKEKLNRAGVRHITAVSGMHIVIISSVIFSLFSLFLKRRKATIISLLFVLFFIALTGFQSSSIRAGIMGSMFLIAPLFGRKSDSIRALTIAFLVMLIVNPLLLIYDVGFQLSFLAVLGIIYLADLFKFRFFPKTIRDIVAMSLSAYIFTLPILIYNFGELSLTGILNNILIVPVVYWIMIFGFLLSIVGLLSSSLAFILSLPCWLLLTYILKVIDIFSWSISFDIHWIWLIFLYLFLFIFVYHLRMKQKTKLSFLRY